MSESEQQEIMPEKKENAAFPGVSLLLKDAFALYSSRFYQLFYVGIILFVLSVLETVAFYGNFPPTVAAAFIAVIIIAVIVVSFLGYLAFIFILSQNPSPASWPDTYLLFKRGWSLLGPYSLIAIFLMFIFIGGGVLLFVPAVIASVYFSFAIYAFAVDNRQGMGALVLSAHVVRGRWWAVFWRMVVYGALSLVLSLLVSLITYGVSGGTPTLANALISSVITASVSSFFLIPFNLSYFFTLYNSLKALSGPIEEQEAKTIKKYSVFLIVVGAVFLIVGSFFAGEALLKYVPQLFITSPMPASVMSAFLH